MFAVGYLDMWQPS